MPSSLRQFFDEEDDQDLVADLPYTPGNSDAALFEIIRAAQADPAPARDFGVYPQDHPADDIFEKDATTRWRATPATPRPDPVYTPGQSEEDILAGIRDSVGPFPVASPRKPTPARAAPRPALPAPAPTPAPAPPEAEQERPVAPGAMAQPKRTPVRHRTEAEPKPYQPPDEQGVVPFVDEGLRRQQAVLDSFKAAQERARRLQAMKAIADTGDELNAGFRAKDKPSYRVGGEIEGMIKAAEGQPLADLKMDALARAEGERVSWADPNSRQNVAYREQMKSVLPQSITGSEAYASMTKPRIEEILKTFIPVEKLDQGGRRVSVAEADSVYRRGPKHDAMLDKQNADQQLAEDRLALDRLDSDRRYRVKMLELQRVDESSSRQAGIQSRHEDRQRDKYAGKFDKNFVSAVTALEDVETIIPGIISAKPDAKAVAATRAKFGVIARLSSYFAANGVGQIVQVRDMTPEDNRLYLQAQNLVDLVTRLRTGAALNQNEQVYYTNFGGTRLIADPMVFYSFINVLAKDVHGRMAAVAPGPGVEALLSYQANGGPETMIPWSNWWKSRGFGQGWPGGDQSPKGAGQSVTVSESRRFSGLKVKPGFVLMQTPEGDVVQIPEANIQKALEAQLVPLAGE